MNVLICDKCGRRIDENSYKRIQIIWIDERKRLPVTYDLCMDCFTNFEKYMKEKDNG